MEATVCTSVAPVAELQRCKKSLSSYWRPKTGKRPRHVVARSLSSNSWWRKYTSRVRDALDGMVCPQSAPSWSSLLFVTKLVAGAPRAPPGNVGEKR